VYSSPVDDAGRLASGPSLHNRSAQYYSEKARRVCWRRSGRNWPRPPNPCAGWPGVRRSWPRGRYEGQGPAASCCGPRGDRRATPRATRPIFSCRPYIVLTAAFFVVPVCQCDHARVLEDQWTRSHVFVGLDNFVSSVHGLRFLAGFCLKYHGVRFGFGLNIALFHGPGVAAQSGGDKVKGFFRLVFFFAPTWWAGPGGHSLQCSVHAALRPHQSGFPNGLALGAGGALAVRASAHHAGHCPDLAVAVGRFNMIYFLAALQTVDKTLQGGGAHRRGQSLADLLARDPAFDAPRA